MSVSAFPHAINNWCRGEFDVSGLFYEGELSGPVSSSIAFRTDGAVDHIGSTSGASERGGYFSCQPETGVGAEYEIRGLSAGKVGTWTTAAAADDVWVAVSSDRIWTVTKASGFGTDSVTQTFELRRVGGPTLDSFAVTVSAEIII